MITHRMRGVLPLIVASAVLVMLVGAGSAIGAIPSRFLLTSYFGKEVNKGTGGNVCTSKEECQPGKESGEAGGFAYPEGVAVNRDPESPTFGDVYVADTINHRVQVLTAAGVFVTMFGWEVNATKDSQPGAKQSEKNVCTAKSGNVCQAGVQGTAPGQFGESAKSIAVDPVNGDVYVVDPVFGESGGEFALGQRVQEFTASGQFVLEIGKEVNATTKGNLCTEEEAEKGAKCQGPALQTRAAAAADSEHGSFNFESEDGDLLAVGGPQDLLYVGDQGRVQEFKSSGASAGAISLSALSTTGKASGVAVDAAGDVFVSDLEAAGVHEYNPAGVLQPAVIDANSGEIRGIALDPNNQIGVLEGKSTNAGFGVFGVLYSTAGVKLSEFAPPAGVLLGFPLGLAFGASGELYIAGDGEQSVEAYTPVVFPETRTCAVEDLTATSAKLCGEINPDGIPARGFFQYGPTPSLGSQTPVVFEGAGEAFTGLSAITSLEPHETYHYWPVAEAEANSEKLQGHGEELTFHTLALPPQIPGAPSAPFVTAQSAVLDASLNPEHLNTRYHFEYGSCAALAGCATLRSSTDEESSQYGTIGSAQEITGLAPGTTYSYRLIANNETEEEGKTIGGKATGVEGTFTTSPAPAPQASTGAASAVTATTATITGSVNPDGVAVTYSFELGVYEGAATQYGIVSSGPTPAGSTPVEETTGLSGLQPGQTYAFRISARSGYIHNQENTVTGTPVLFTTGGIPAVLSTPAPLPQLAIPTIGFPTETKTTTKKVKQAAKCAKGKHRSHGRCVKTRLAKHRRGHKK